MTTVLDKYASEGAFIACSTDVYGRVWAEVKGDLHFTGSCEDPLPFHIYATGRVTFDEFKSKLPNLDATSINLKGYESSKLLTEVELRAKERIIVSKTDFKFLSKNTKQLNKIGSN